jgi:serine/threonine-protein kinase
MSEPTDALRQYLSPGERLDDRYDIEDEIDAGSFGVIYRARDLRTGERLAVKALPPLGEGPSDETSVGRFEREMYVIENLEHESLVELHDYGRTDEGVAYMVLEHIEGRDLDTWLADEGAMTLDGALGIARQLAEGLEAAHEAGVVHRDLKPGNIMIVPSTTGHRAKLLDFGMAKLLDTLDEQTIADLTREGTAVGTPRYIAPEQARGEDSIGPWTDLYALGLLLYEMIVGEKAVQANTIEDALRAHLNPAPHELEGFEHCPESVEELIRSMIRKDHEARLDSASAVLRHLDEMAASPIQADPSVESAELFGPPMGSDNGAPDSAESSSPRPSPSDPSSEKDDEFEASDDLASSDAPPSEEHDAPSDPSLDFDTPSGPSIEPDAAPPIPEGRQGTSSQGDGASSAPPPPPPPPGRAPPPGGGTARRPHPPPPRAPRPPPEHDDDLEVDWESYERSSSVTRSPDVAHTGRSSRQSSRSPGTSDAIGMAVLPFALSLSFLTVSAQLPDWHPVFRTLFGLAPLWFGLAGSRHGSGPVERTFVRIAVVASLLCILGAHLAGPTSLARQLWNDPVWFMAPVEHLPVFGSIAEGLTWASRQYAAFLASLPHVGASGSSLGTGVESSPRIDVFGDS